MENDELIDMLSDISSEEEFLAWVRSFNIDGLYRRISPYMWQYELNGNVDSLNKIRKISKDNNYDIKNVIKIVRNFCTRYVPDFSRQI